MRLMIYTHSFDPNIGGVESYVGWLAEGLATGGARDDVVVVTPTRAAVPDDGRFPYRVVRAPRLRDLWQLVARAEVVHLAGPVLWPLLIARLARRRVVVEHHGYQVVCPDGLLWHRPTRSACPGHFAAGRYGKCVACIASTEGATRGVRALLLTFVRRLLCRAVGANVAVSDHVRARVRLPRSLTIVHGVPDRAPVEAPVPARPATPCFAYVGRLVEEKGLLLLLAAAEQLRGQGVPVRIRLIGDGPDRHRLEQAARAHMPDSVVEFLGWRRGPDLEVALDGVLAVVMPSLWEETAGLAAIEHMMRGRLVIAANTGGLSEMVGQGGWLFQRGDAAGLAVAMRRAIDEPDAVRQTGVRARERARSTFAPSRMVSEHRALYAALASRQGP